MSTVVRIHEYGPPSCLVVEDERVRPPSQGEVRIRHEAIGVNFVDTMMRRGLYALPLPAVLGVEGVGIVEAVGSHVDGVAVDDRVAYYDAIGSYAASRVVAAKKIALLPADIDPIAMAGIFAKGLTAWAALNLFHPINAGDSVLVQGASSSLGVLISRWATSLGAKVVGSASSDAKRAHIGSSLALTVRSTDADLASQVRGHVPGGVDVVYDLIGESTVRSSLDSVRDGGTVVLLGFASGDPVINDDEVVARSIAVVGGSASEYVLDSFGEGVSSVFQAYREGRFGQLTTNRYPLTEVRRVHEEIEARRYFGAYVLSP